MTPGLREPVQQDHGRAVPGNRDVQVDPVAPDALMPHRDCVDDLVGPDHGTPLVLKAEGPRAKGQG